MNSSSTQETRAPWGAGFASLEPVRTQRDTAPREPALPANSSAERPIAPPARLRPGQFDLRSLLLAMAVCSGVFAIGASLGLGAGVLAGWFVILVAVHVAANAWGTRTWHPDAERDREPPPSLAPRVGSELAVPQPATLLGKRDRVLRIIVLGAALGGLTAGLAGGASLYVLYAAQRGVIAAAFFGGIAAAVLGAIFGGTLATTTAVGLSAWLEALAASGTPLERRAWRDLLRRRPRS